MRSLHNYLIVYYFLEKKLISQKINDKTILITIQVTTGKYSEKFSFLISMSPGNLPNNLTLGKIVNIIPMSNIIAPIIMKYFPIDCIRLFKSLPCLNINTVLNGLGDPSLCSG